VRPAGRGGAFVAGADDAGALWYNPAGLAALLGGDPRSFLLDASYVGHSVSYTRIDSGGNTLPAVEDESQFLPLPTLAVQFDLGERWSLGVGLLAPYAALDEYPEGGGQRYSLVSFHGSVLATLEAAVAFKLTDDIFLGAGIQNMFVKLRSELAFSACPKEIVCAPEDPEFDALGQIDASSWFTPSAIFGIQAKAASWLRVGAAVQLPFFVGASGTVKVRLPSSGFYNGAHVEGDAADASITFPLIVRVGAEVRPDPRVAIEVGLDWEAWSMQDELKVTPHDVRVEGAAGVGTYAFGPLAIPRRFKDTLALRLGVEAEAVPGLYLRGGFVHESGASPDDYLSVLTVDTDKNVISAGIGYRFGKVRVDAMVGHAFMGSRDLPAGTSCAPQLNPIRPPAGDACVHDGSPDHVYVGDGSYRSSWTFAGVGMEAGF
jgi:long-chain fatty acid transport protein